MTGGDHRFDLLGDLPTGTVAIEASAGTGKTFTLAALATRFIAEGRSTAAELLIVTFTRAATHELRGRVRDQLVEAAAHLHAHLAAEAPPTASNELLDFLVSTDQEARLDRVRRAIADFDAATVVTIHGFATQVRASLSSSALIDPDARLVDDADDVVADASADALAAATVGRSIGVELPTLEKVTSAAKVAVGRPGIGVAPSAGQTGADEQALELAALVERSRDLVVDRRRRNGTIGFDDVLVQLSQSLVAPGSAGLVESVRGRYNVALIDEFQDTDATQWAIFRRLFAEAGPSRTLVLVGDPKQAIYSFRGADIHTYLEAVGPESGTDRRSLATNWRSDGALLRSLQLLFEGVTFGSAGIPFVAVGPAEDNRDRRMVRREGRPSRPSPCGWRPARTSTPPPEATGSTPTTPRRPSTGISSPTYETSWTPPRSRRPGTNPNRGRSFRPTSRCWCSRPNRLPWSRRNCCARPSPPSSRAPTAFSAHRQPSSSAGSSTPWTDHRTPDGPGCSHSRGSAGGPPRRWIRRPTPNWPRCRSAWPSGRSSWQPTRSPTYWPGSGAAPRWWPACCARRTATGT